MADHRRIKLCLLLFFFTLMITESQGSRKKQKKKEDEDEGLKANRECVYAHLCKCKGEREIGAWNKCFVEVKSQTFEWFQKTFNEPDKCACKKKPLPPVFTLEEVANFICGLECRDECFNQMNGLAKGYLQRIMQSEDPKDQEVAESLNLILNYATSNYHHCTMTNNSCMTDMMFGK